jgi:hypothetical protein
VKNISDFVLVLNEEFFRFYTSFTPERLFYPLGWKPPSLGILFSTFNEPR